MLSADGLGDFASTMWAVGRRAAHATSSARSRFPHSLGMYYTALTQYLGFWKFGDEYKVMGLAAYGQPEYLDEFRRIVRADGPLSFRLGLEYFTHQRQGAEMTWRDADQTPVLGRLFSPYLEKRLGPDAPGRRAARAAAPQSRRQHASALEEVLFRNWNALARKHGQKALCLAGGVAFNCVANGKIFDRTPFERVFVQPAAGDAGLSVGAAFAVHHQVLGQPREFVMDHAYWGPELLRSRDSRGDRAQRSCRAATSQIAELAEDAAAASDRAPHRRRKNCRLVSGPRRMGAARARQSQHPGRSAPRRR